MRLETYWPIVIQFFNISFFVYGPWLPMLVSSSVSFFPMRALKSPNISVYVVLLVGLNLG